MTATASATDATPAVTTIEEAWVDLVAVAVLGTDRRPLPDRTPGLIEPFGTGSEPAVALLDRAAAILAARRAGAPPGEAAPTLDPSPVDTRPPCPTPAARRLGAMLAGRHADLLPEWLAELAERGLALPPEHVVPVMDAARAVPALRSLAAATAGPLAVWLAELFPQSGWVLPSGDPSWEHGTPSERLDALRRLRATDPVAARELLRGGLPGEKVEHRAACLAALADRLGPEDEQLLEAALDDRSPAVRHVATELLGRLPTSAWAARMAARARACVTVTGPAGEDALDIRLVSPVPSDWERDGVSTAAPRGTSLGVHVLRQVIAGTPLATWSSLAPPSHLIVLAGEHELGSELIAAWVTATTRQRDATWARLLVEESDDPSLVPVLTAEELVPLAARAVTPGQVLTPRSLAVLAAIPPPWPPELRRAAVVAVVGLFVERRTGRHQAPLLRRLARLLDHEVLSGLAEDLESLGLPPPLDGVRDDLVDLLRFRGTMVDELGPSPGRSPHDPGGAR